MTETFKQSIWTKTKMLIKGGVILVLLLLFLIPANQIKDMVLEREARQEEAVTEVTSRWAGQQTVTGPVLVLPYISLGDDKKTMIRKRAFVLPDVLKVNGEILPEKKHRGIYEVMLYKASAKVEGSFSRIPLEMLQLNPEQVNWREAYMVIDISDLKGLTEDVEVNWNGTTLAANSGRPGDGQFQQGLIAPVPISADSSFNFSFDLQLKGSRNLLFTTLGKTTDLTLRSTWKDPSFTGVDLPQFEITNDGFNARWKTLSHGRTFPQAWKDQVYPLNASSLGTELFIPVNAYQKTYRTVKYASLLILLTFIAFFLVETYTRKSVHPVHYALVGVALILFYTLLLSFAEHIQFNLAYFIAALATILLISWFTRAVLQSGRWGTLLGTVLVLLYGYIFSILQLQDYSLLLGSIGLFIVLGVVMYFVRKLEW